MAMQVTSSGYGRQDAAAFSAQFPRPGGGTATVQVAGVPQPVAAAPATGQGNPTFPWVGFIVALVGLRLASHLRRE